MTTACAGTLPPPVMAEDPGFQPVGEGRAAGILRDLALKDSERAARIQRYVQNFIIGTKNINEGSNVPEGEKRPRLEAERAALYAGLEAEKLNAEERLVVLNGLSANYYRINYDAFVDLVPDLTDAQKAFIHEQLFDAFDEAILLNSGSAKGELFIKRRGRINNYLSEQGYDLRALSVARNERLRQR